MFSLTFDSLDLIITVEDLTQHGKGFTQMTFKNVAWNRFENSHLMSPPPKGVHSEAVYCESAEDYVSARKHLLSSIFDERAKRFHLWIMDAGYLEVIAMEFSAKRLNDFVFDD